MYFFFTRSIFNKSFFEEYFFIELFERIFNYDKNSSKHVSNIILLSSHKVFRLFFVSIPFEFIYY